jgi:hypothetical protein
MCVVQLFLISGYLSDLVTHSSTRVPTPKATVIAEVNISIISEREIIVFLLFCSFIIRDHFLIVVIVNYRIRSRSLPRSLLVPRSPPIPFLFQLLLLSILSSFLFRLFHSVHVIRCQSWCLSPQQEQVRTSTLLSILLRRVLRPLVIPAPLSERVTSNVPVGRRNVNRTPPHTPHFIIKSCPLRMVGIFRRDVQYPVCKQSRCILNYLFLESGRHRCSRNRMVI